MKNYIDVTNDLLARRDRYVAEQKKNRRRIMTATAGLCCACLVAFVGIKMGQKPTTLEETYVYTINPPLVLEQSGAQQTEAPVADDMIHILKIDTIPVSSQMSICLLRNDFVPMSRNELNTYYGLDVFPSVPEDLKESTNHYGVYRQNGGEGELYWNDNDICYTNEDQSRSVKIMVSKGKIPYVFCDLFHESISMSKISNVEVGLAQTESGEYYGEFLYQDVGFRIGATGLTQEEFVAIISSLLS